MNDIQNLIAKIVLIQLIRSNNNQSLPYCLLNFFSIPLRILSVQVSARLVQQDHTTSEYSANPNFKRCFMPEENW